MDIKKVLVGFDFSPSSTTAVEHASHIARLHQAELVFIHATDLPKHAQPRGTESKSEQKVRADLAQTTHRLLERRKELEARGVRTSQRLVDDDPDDALIDASKETGAELVVVGWPRPEPGEWLRRRSVAEKVARNAEASVLVARSPSPVFGSGYGSILVPMDFSKTAERALKLALTLIKPGGTIDVVHFWQSTPVEYPHLDGPLVGVRGKEFRSDGEMLFQKASDLGRQLLDKFATESARLVFSHADERPIEGIEKRIQDKQYKLTVMGSHGYQGIRRWGVGSVSEATMRNLFSSILVVPPAGEY